MLNRFIDTVESQSVKEKVYKNNEIIILDNYEHSPGEEFWSSFPFNPLPIESKPNTPVSSKKLDELFWLYYEDLSPVMREFCQMTISDLTHGADSLIDFNKVQPLFDVNSSNMFKKQQGSFFTDQLVTMIKKGFVSGPFSEPPFDNLRVNSLFIIEQPDKYRPILNLSAPEGLSFNEAIDDYRMTKVIMSSPVKVAKKLSHIGQGAFMSKIDHQSAYKLIPTRYEHLFLQGFVWLDHYFIETSQVFGARSSVPSYDRFHLCFSEIVQIASKTDKFYFERQLDDQIIMAKSYEKCKQISDTYLSLAKNINLPLAPFDNPEKAFLNKKSGTILGITFDTQSMTWTLPHGKFVKFCNIIKSILSKSKSVFQKDLERVLGCINTVTQMSHSLKFFRNPIVADLKRSYKCEPIMLSNDCIDFLHKWLYILHDLKNGFPIPKFDKYPPAMCIAFATDAAGGAALRNEPQLEIGVGAVGFIRPYQSHLSDFFYNAQCLWPKKFISEIRDIQNRAFGNKTTLLETLGVFVPIFHNIDLVINKSVLIFVDNVAVVWAYQNGRSRTDVYTSMFIYILELIANSFNIRIYLTHVPRVSTLPALLADTLTRTDPKGRSLLKSLSLPILNQWPKSIRNWMENPKLDWDLGSRVLSDFRHRLKGTGVGFWL